MTASPARIEPRDPATARREDPRDLLAFCDRAAWWLDDCLRVPGTRFRFGLDAIVGLVPFAGDVLGFAVSGLTLLRALQAGVPRALLGRMVGNVAIDAVGSAVPWIGDVFDTVFKAHRRNFELLRRHYAATDPKLAAVPRQRSRAPQRIALLGLLAVVAVLVWLHCN